MMEGSWEATEVKKTLKLPPPYDQVPNSHIQHDRIPDRATCSLKHHTLDQTFSRWWYETFRIFNPTWGNDPI